MLLSFFQSFQQTKNTYRGLKKSLSCNDCYHYEYANSKKKQKKLLAFWRTTAPILESNLWLSSCCRITTFRALELSEYAQGFSCSSWIDTVWRYFTLPHKDRHIFPVFYDLYFTYSTWIPAVLLNQTSIITDPYGELSSVEPYEVWIRAWSRFMHAPGPPYASTFFIHPLYYSIH